MAKGNPNPCNPFQPGNDFCYGPRRKRSEKLLFKYLSSDGEKMFKTLVDGVRDADTPTEKAKIADYFLRHTLLQPKVTSDPVSLPPLGKQTLGELSTSVDAVLERVESGELSPEVAQTIVKLIEAKVEILKMGELEKKVNDIQERLGIVK